MVMFSGVGVSPVEGEVSWFRGPKTDSIRASGPQVMKLEREGIMKQKTATYLRLPS